MATAKETIKFVS